MNRILKLVCGLAFICGSMVTTSFALAASGWYLLQPPWSKYDEHAEYLQGFKILDTKPLSQWSQESAYDSASVCEASKQAFIMGAQGFYSKSNADYITAVGENKDSAALKQMRWVPEMANASVNSWMKSRCIKSDDPRLGK